MYFTNLTELLERNTSQNPDSIAAISGDETMTFLELANRSQTVASWLVDNGLQKGDRVGIYLRKSFAEMSATLGTAMSGGVFVNINPQWTAEQAAFIQQDCDVRLLISERALIKQLDRADVLGQFDRVLAIDEAGTESPNVDRLDDLDSDTKPMDRMVVDADLAALLYTSGSTGKPKGVKVTHRNLIDGAHIVTRYLGLRPTDRLLGLLPLSFDYGLNQFMCCLLNGSTIVLQKVAMPSEIVSTIQKHDVTCMAAVPPVWIQLCRYLSESNDKLSTLRLITNSGGKIPEQYLRMLPSLLPKTTEIFLMYGLTEAFRSTFLDPSKYLDKLGSMGRAIPNVETYVVSLDGQRICERGEHGELVHRGALVSQGYWGNPDATNERIRPCPALSQIAADELVVFSGDIVYEDDDGYLWFVERNDSMIKCSGFRISTTEIEEALYKHESILEAIAFGVANDDLGQEVHVAVTTKEPMDDVEREIGQLCRKLLPNYMIPKRVHSFDTAFPRTSSGKLDRPAIKRLCHEQNTEN